LTYELIIRRVLSDIIVRNQFFLDLAMPPDPWGNLVARSTSLTNLKRCQCCCAGGTKVLAASHFTWSHLRQHSVLSGSTVTKDRSTLAIMETPPTNWLDPGDISE
jgi:hypothetical protein